MNDFTNTTPIFALGYMFRIARPDALLRIVFREAIAMSTLTAALVVLVANLCLLLALVLMGSLLFHSY